MKRIRGIICLLFFVSCVVTAAYYVKVKMVEDTTPPEITYKEDTITVSVKDGSQALLEGMTAEDNRDGDLTDSIRVDSVGHFIGGHKRTANYVVFDSSNLVGTCSRTVVYSDYTPTKIKVKKPFMVLSNQFDNYDLGANVVATDCLDGDISNQVRTLISQDFYGEPGTYSLTLEVSNSAGDVRTIPMDIQIIDIDDDEMMNKAFPLLNNYVVYTKKGRAVDPKKYIDGLMIGGREYPLAECERLYGITADDISYSVKDVDYKTPGIYTITYSFQLEGEKRAETKCYVVVEGAENE